MQLNIKEKRYYGIGELAQAFDVNASLIRYWESQFDFFSPQKNQKGARRYTQKDLENLKLIYHVVKELGFTLQGARQYLKEQRVKAQENQAVVLKLEHIKTSLIKIQEDLKLASE